MSRILALLALVLPVFALAMPTANELESFVDTQMEDSALPGIAWAVVDDESVSVDARGVADQRTGEEVTGSTPFLLGSISKSFTALAIMQLAEADKVDLDAPVAQYVPEFDGQSAGAITIRQLLGHTSGYSTLQGNSAPADSDAGPDAIARRAAWYAQQAPATAAGTQWAYSNANYLVLGRVIETASGVPYPAYIRANILDPLGMEDSYVAGDGTGSALAQGHVPWFGGMKPVGVDPPGLGAAPQGGIVSTVSDMARYLQMMLNGQDDILSAAGKARMLQPAGDGVPGYGFGWMLNAEEQSAYHTGLSPGFETIAAMIPAKRRGVVVLTNGGSGMGFAETGDLRFGLVARALDLPQPADGGAWMRKLNFIVLVVAPLFFVGAIGWAWAKRKGLRSKRDSAFGRVSLWLPLFAMAAVAWVCVWLVPQLFGISLSTLALYQPDMALLLKATAALGMVWAVVRLAIAYTGQRASG